MKYIMSLALHDFFQIMIKIMLAFENPAIFLWVSFSKKEIQNKSKLYIYSLLI